MLQKSRPLSLLLRILGCLRWISSGVQSPSHVLVLNPGQCPKVGDGRVRVKYNGNSTPQVQQLAVGNIEGLIGTPQQGSKQTSGALEKANPYMVDSMSYWNWNYAKLCLIFIARTDLPGNIQSECNDGSIINHGIYVMV